VETADSTYGSDKDGLVCGYLFVPGAPATPIDADAAAEWLAAAVRSPIDSFVWLNFSLANAASERWIRRHLLLPESFLECLHGDIASTRLEQDGDALVAVIHDVLFDFTFDPGSVSTVSLCVEPSFLISARLRPLRSVDRFRASIKTGQIFRSSADLLGHLLRDQAEVLVNIVRQSTTRVDFIEDKLLADRISTSRRDLGSLRRTLVRLQRLLAPEPAALFRLLSRPPAWIGGEDVQPCCPSSRSRCFSVTWRSDGIATSAGRSETELARVHRLARFHLHRHDPALDVPRQIFRD
jgi:zinc transporter